MRSQREDGFVMVVVIGLTMVLTLFVVALLRFSLGTFRQAARDERWEGALDAAEAGVDDFLFRLNRDGRYWRYSATNPPPDGNQAFSTFVPVPGSSNPGEFTYRVDTSDLAAHGILTLTSTGRVGDVERTVEVQLRRRNFLDFLYFTDLETMDPAMYPTSGSRNRTWAQANCTAYAYAGRHPDCVEIFFYGDRNFQDVIRGPLHTNDAMRIFGIPRFEGETTSSWPLEQDPDTCQPPRWIDGKGDSAPSFARRCDPAFADVLPLPPSNQKIKLETDPALGRTGCLLTGPSKIELLPDGRVRITSPFTRRTNCAAVDGTPIPLPANGVIYVQNVPSDPADPNYTAGCPFPGGHPFADDLDRGDITSYGCRDGDVFLWGTLKGELTIAAENDITIVWHTRVADPTGDDVLGLVANNYVQIYHPWGCTRFDRRGRCQAIGDLPARFHDPRSTTPFRDAVVQAAILAVTHSFRVQNHDLGVPLGTLSVTGAIAQKYRGPVGTFDTRAGRVVTGFEKAYVYDDRLRYLSPPHFLDPVESAWRVVVWKE